MTMKAATDAFTRARTASDVRAAYRAMLEWSDAPEGLEADDVDNMLNQHALPSLAQRLREVEKM
jgi:hypothetical protein